MQRSARDDNRYRMEESSPQSSYPPRPRLIGIPSNRIIERWQRRHALRMHQRRGLDAVHSRCIIRRVVVGRVALQICLIAVTIR